jgi:aminoglycoside phosphotransferase (APT) family kinase protein
MFTRISPTTLVSLATKGASWLADFHATRQGATHDTTSWNARTTRAIARFADTFGAVIDPALLRETASALAQPDEAVTSVIEHRDFGPWNILIDDSGTLTVLDWESSRVHGLPLLDLIYFITYMAFFVDGAMVSRRFAESYRATLDPRSSTGAMRAELMEQYRQRFGISPEMEWALRSLCWIEHADSEFQHFTADAGGRPPVEALRASVFMQLWKEEIVALRR